MFRIKWSKSLSFGANIVFLMICFIQGVTSKLTCTIYYSDQENGDGYINTYKKEVYVCFGIFETCCETGCCSIFSQMAWYIQVIIGFSFLIILLILIVIGYYLRVFFILMKIRRNTRITGIVRIVDSTDRNEGLPKIERSPESNDVVYLPISQKDDVPPSYEAATKQ